MEASAAPFCSNVQFELPSPKAASILLNTLAVDLELQPDKVSRTYAVDGTTFTATFRATEIRVLRSALSSFYDMSIVAVRALAEFDER